MDGRATWSYTVTVCVNSSFLCGEEDETRFSYVIINNIKDLSTIVVLCKNLDLL